MFRRLMGLILMISVLMPILLGVAGYVVVRQIAGDIENVARGPLQRIDTRLDEMRSTLDTVNQAVGRVTGLISSIVTQLRNLTLSIRVPSLSIPDIVFRFPDPIGRQRIPVPNIPGFELLGLRQIRDVLLSLGGIFGDLTDALQQIAAVQSLAGELNDVVTDVRGLTADIGKIGAKWLSTLTLIGVGLAIWIAATYVALTYRWLSAGWSMLRGRPVG